MWAQYGGNHSGLCLLFNRVKMLEEVGDQLENGDNQWYSGHVRYTDDFVPLVLTLSGRAIASDGIDLALREHQTREYMSLFFQKNPDWATEYEYRFVVQRDDAGYFYVAVAKSLVGIVLGERVSDVYGASIDATTSAKDVAACQLRWRNGEPGLELPQWQRPKWYQRAR